MNIQTLGSISQQGPLVLTLLLSVGRKLRTVLVYASSGIERQEIKMTTFLSDTFKCLSVVSGYFGLWYLLFHRHVKAVCLKLCKSKITTKPTSPSQLKHHAQELQEERRSTAANFCHPTNHTSKISNTLCSGIH